MPRLKRSDAELAMLLGGTLVSPQVLLVDQVVADPTLTFNPVDLGAQLRLVRGVGPWMEERLQEQGYVRLQDLAEHPYFGPDARECLEAIRLRDAHQLKRRGATFSQLASLFTFPELRFLDIETLGLGFSQEIIVVGMLAFQQGSWQMRQVVALDLTCQKELLQQTLRLLGKCRICMTYNGSTFDLPFLRYALQWHGIDGACLESLFSADLLHPVRRSYRTVLRDCCLQTVAREVLGLQRSDHMAGALIPLEYARFLRTRNPSILSTIITHNQQDLLALLELTRHLLR